MKPYDDPHALKREIEQEAYRFYESLSGIALARDAGGRILSQGHNDALDAFRHAYTSGRVTQLAGGVQPVARHFGDANETGPAHPNEPREHRMDLWNNEVGRRLGAETLSGAALARRAYAGVLDGTLVTGLADPRLDQLYPDDARLQRPTGDPQRELLDPESVERINRDVERMLDHAHHRPRASASQAAMPCDPAVRGAASGKAHHPIAEQIRAGVHRSDARHGRQPDESSERLTLQLLLAVRRDPLLKRVDDVVFSRPTADAPGGARAFAVYRPHGDAAPYFYTSVDVVAAIRVPPAESLRELNALAQPAAPLSTVQPSTSPTHPTPGAPRMG